MTTTINASTSSGLVVTPDNSGNVLLQYNGVAAPAFSAYLTGGQNFSNTTATKIVFNTEDFDTNSNFSTSTGTFTPTVAGYYQANFIVEAASTGGSNVLIAGLYKNGAAFKTADQRFVASNVMDVQGVSGSAVVYLNGSTDYLEVWGYISGTGTNTFRSSTSGCQFSACLLRGA
jgi:hypothetical protein